jgi:hypothetical protein
VNAVLAIPRSLFLPSPHAGVLILSLQGCALHLQFALLLPQPSACERRVRTGTVGLIAPTDEPSAPDRKFHSIRNSGRALPCRPSPCIAAVSPPHIGPSRDMATHSRRRRSLCGPSCPSLRSAMSSAQIRILRSEKVNQCERCCYLTKDGE